MWNDFDSINIEPRGGTLSDSAALNQAFADMAATGLPLVLQPNATFRIDDTVLFPPASSTISTQREFLISGYGAVLTGEAPFLLNLGTGIYLPYGLVVRGLTFSMRGNTASSGAVCLRNTSHVTLRDLAFLYGNNNADFDAILVENRIATDPDTGCFWTLIEGCGFRVLDGADAFIRSAVHLSGTANATTLRANAITGTTDAFLIDTPDTTGSVANGLLLDGNWIEGVSRSVLHVVANANNPLSGARVVNNRFEAIAETILYLEGATAQPAVPISVANNYTIGLVPLAYNPESLYINCWDTQVTPAISPDLFAPDGLSIGALSSNKDALTARASNIGSGIALANFNRSLLGSWRQRASYGSSLAGNAASGAYHPVFATTFLGSTTATEVRNPIAYAAFNAESTKAVTLPVEEADANYIVNLMPRNNPTEPAPTGWTFKSPSATGFTIELPTTWTGIMFYELRR